jgi:glycosyltransferase involved in cell wall biosynthesis
MATYDDYDGVYFSLQALRMYHPEIVEEAEFVVVDNHPDGPCAEQLKQLEHHIANYRYIPAGEFTGTAIKNAVFVNAGGEFVLCMDSHVFFVPGALKRLIAYMRAQPETRDLLQGPLVYDDLKTFSTHFDPVWRGGMYGTWGTDPRGRASIRASGASAAKRATSTRKRASAADAHCACRSCAGCTASTDRWAFPIATPGRTAFATT